MDIFYTTSTKLLQEDIFSILKEYESSAFFSLADILSRSPNPGLFIEGTGIISLPLSDSGANAIVSLAKRLSKHGDGQISEKVVPGIWELPHSFRITNLAWDDVIESVIAKVCNTLGIDGTSDRIQADLRCLTLYEEGADYLHNKNVTTSLANLELWQSLFLHTMREDYFIAWCSYVAYTIGPISTGKRLLLIYDLLHTPEYAVKALETSPVENNGSRLIPMLNRWNDSFRDNSSLLHVPQTLAYPLGRHYSDDELSRSSFAEYGTSHDLDGTLIAFRQIYSRGDILGNSIFENNDGLDTASQTLQDDELIPLHCHTVPILVPAAKKFKFVLGMLYNESLSSLMPVSELWISRLLKSYRATHDDVRRQALRDELDLLSEELVSALLIWKGENLALTDELLSHEDRITAQLIFAAMTMNIDIALLRALRLLPCQSDELIFWDLSLLSGLIDLSSLLPDSIATMKLKFARHGAALGIFWKWCASTILSRFREYSVPYPVVLAAVMDVMYDYEDEIITSVPVKTVSDEFTPYLVQNFSLQVLSIERRKDETSSENSELS
ncbi:2og-fe oxygenase superfamily protein [Phlyctema vagabunda]|uniref:2og-fe oxygenase superfamily protein n=1 Tax=Phlyctema vagabunda TaxID=108571 RepID=A0ABR4PQW5_9HELO